MATCQNLTSSPPITSLPIICNGCNASNGFPAHSGDLADDDLRFPVKRKAPSQANFRAPASLRSNDDCRAVPTAAGSSWCAAAMPSSNPSGAADATRALMNVAPALAFRRSARGRHHSRPRNAAFRTRRRQLANAKPLVERWSKSPWQDAQFEISTVKLFPLSSKAVKNQTGGQR
jgi:hypothetical protein